MRNITTGFLYFAYLFLGLTVGAFLWRAGLGIGAGVAGAFQFHHPLFEHAGGGVGIARVDEAGVLAVEARFRRFGGRIDEALRQEDRLGCFAEAGAHRSGVYHGGCRTERLFRAVGHGKPRGGQLRATRP